MSPSTAILISGSDVMRVKVVKDSQFPVRNCPTKIGHGGGVRLKMVNIPKIRTLLVLVITIALSDLLSNQSNAPTSFYSLLKAT